MVDGGGLPSGRLNTFGKPMRGKGTLPPSTPFSEEGNVVVPVIYSQALIVTAQVASSQNESASEGI
jgi:hypothetical protein